MKNGYKSFGANCRIVQDQRHCTGAFNTQILIPHTATMSFACDLRPTKKIPMRFRTLWSCGRHYQSLLPLVEDPLPKCVSQSAVDKTLKETLQEVLRAVEEEQSKQGTQVSSSETTVAALYSSHLFNQQTAHVCILTHAYCFRLKQVPSTVSQRNTAQMTTNR